MNGPGMSLGTTIPAHPLESLLGQAAPRGRMPEWNPSFLINSMYLVVALLAGALLIALVSRWRKGQRGDPVSPSNQLAHYRSLYEKGEISQEEFQQLRSLLGGKIRAESKVAPTPSAPPPADDRIQAAPPDNPAAPHNPPGPSLPPDSGIRPA